jgi:hypothetical protein
MVVLKATQQQYNTLNGYTFHCSKLEFQKDFNNNWIVGLEVLEDIAFLKIREQLKALPLIDFEPIETPNI